MSVLLVSVVNFLQWSGRACRWRCAPECRCVTKGTPSVSVASIPFPQAVPTHVLSDSKPSLGFTPEPGLEGPP